MRPEDFLTAPCNALAHHTIGAWPDWPDPVLVLCGPAGSGKTHLARIWAAEAGAWWLPTPLTARAERQAEWLTGRYWVVDGAERASDETFLFHLINAARACRGGLLLTSRWPPAAWRPELADLRSRLMAAHLVRIEAIDDSLLAAVLVKQFRDRQLRLEPAVVDYLCLHMERSFACARNVVQAMDRLALTTKRSMSVGLARDALRALGVGEQDRTNDNDRTDDRDLTNTNEAGG